MNSTDLKLYLPCSHMLIVRDNVRQFVFSSNSGGPKVFISKNVYILDFHLQHLKG